MNFHFSTGEIRQMVTTRLSHNFSVTPAEATEEQLYSALACIVRDLMQANYTEFMKKADQQKKKRVYYL